MSIEHVRHLTYLLNEDIDILDDRVVDGVHRLLMDLKREVFDAEASLARAEETYGHLPASQDGGFLKMTNGEIIEMYRSSFGDAKQHLDQVRTILLALAGGNLEEIERVMDARRDERKAWVEAQRRKNAQKKPTEAAAPSTAPDTSTAKEPQKTDRRAGVAADMPYVDVLNKVRDALGDAALAAMKKDDLEGEIRRVWDLHYPHIPLSAHMLSTMATMLRPHEAQLGRRRPRRLSG